MLIDFNNYPFEDQTYWTYVFVKYDNREFFYSDVLINLDSYRWLDGRVAAARASTLYHIEISYYAVY